MSHEYQYGEPILSAEQIFKRAAQLAVTHGRIRDGGAGGAYERNMREFIIDVFPDAVTQQYPGLREVTFVPLYRTDDEPLPIGDHVFITMADELISTTYLAALDSNDGAYTFDVISREPVIVPDSDTNILEGAGNYLKEIDTLFGGDMSDPSIDYDKLERLHMIFTEDISATPEEVMIISDILHTLERAYAG